MAEFETDVLVLGGGPAGAWAAVSAATAGARVVLVDKARCGASGPTACGMTSLWNIPPGSARDDAVRRAYAHGGGLAEPEWMLRVLDETHRRVEQLAQWGYRFDESGAEITGHRRGAFAAIADGHRIYAALDDVPYLVWRWLSRQGLVDRTRRVLVRAVLEGAVRGTGGLRIAGADCATTVAGLYGAGDVMTREPITGAVSGFGGQGGACSATRRQRLLAGRSKQCRQRLLAGRSKRHCRGARTRRRTGPHRGRSAPVVTAHRISLPNCEFLLTPW